MEKTKAERDAIRAKAMVHGVKDPLLVEKKLKDLRKARYQREQREQNKYDLLA